MSFIYQAREAVEMRAQLEKKVAQREKEKQEDKLRKLAQKAREARAGIQSASEKSHDEKERDQMRYERHKDREKERRIAKAAPDKRYCKLTRGCQLTLPIVYC